MIKYNKENVFWGCDMIVQYFDWYVKSEDKLWKTLAQDAKHLKSLGVRALWMPPAYKGTHGNKDAGYGVYDMYDMGEFDQKGSIATKYGTQLEYQECVETLNDMGIDVIADIVLNHKLGADRSTLVRALSVDPQNREEVGRVLDIEAWTQFDFKARDNKYSSFKWNKDHFTSVDFDRKTNTKGLFLFEGKSWAHNIDIELGNYDYLMGADVDFKHPEVIREYEMWIKWYLSKYSIQGLRLDAIKHIDFDFFHDWLETIRTHQPLFVVGEYWSHDLRLLLNYIIESEYSMSLFDVPLHFNLEKASTLEEHYDLRQIFVGSLVQNLPDYAVTFVDNHDTQTGQSLQSYIKPWFRESANALILLRHTGTPCVFYLDYKNEAIQKLMQLRHHIGDVAYDMFDEHDCIGWSYITEPGLCVLMSNHTTRLKKMFVGKLHAGKVFKDALGNCDEHVTIDAKGNGMFKVEAKSVSVYTLEGRIHEIIL